MLGSFSKFFTDPHPYKYDGPHSAARAAEPEQDRKVMLGALFHFSRSSAVAPEGINCCAIQCVYFQLNQAVTRRQTMNK